MLCLHIVPRKVAKERGFKRFLVATPCKNGHIAERNTKSSVCLICEKDKKKVYRAENPEKARASVRRSAQKYAEKRKEGNKAWREKNREYLLEAKKRYAQENKEKVLAAKKRYYQENKERCLAASKRHHKENREHYRRLARKWREENRDKVRLNNRKRKEKIKNAEGHHTVDDIKDIYQRQNGVCPGCRKKFDGNNYHVDHIYPLALGGSNWPSNLQLLCPPCNMSKGGRPPEEFYQKRGFLL